MTRIAITGGPRTGKTTLATSMAAETGLAIVATDDYLDMGWSEASEHVAGLLAADEPRIVEGVAVPRALRKALASRPDVAPIDRLIVLTAPHAEQTRGQEIMAKGLHTVLDGILPELRRLGVEVEIR
jgi:adenylate kinase family enzyme